MPKLADGEAMHVLMRRLFPICRSLTGEGVRETLRILRQQIPIVVREVKTGTKVFDWTIPPEWEIRDAYIADETGTRVVDFRRSNLHVVGYSVPVNRTLTLEELQPHLHSLPDQPDAIPYVTSYYRRTWGFCLTHRQRVRLRNGRYRVVIDSSLKKGSLTYGELLIPGRQKEEVFLSTYVCHPSLANNELSGPVVTTRLARYIRSKRRRYTYRIVFVPETIGAVAYLARNLGVMKRNIIAGFNLTCCGDERMYSLMPSRSGATLADKVARRVLQRLHPEYTTYSFLERESDERQYQSVLVDLPVVSIMRSKYHAYPEYHTSLDDLTVVTPRGLQGTYDVYRACIDDLESRRRYVATVPGEPQLGKRGLYQTFGKSRTTSDTKVLVDTLAYADGTHDLDDFCRLFRVGRPVMQATIRRLVDEKLLREV